MGVKITYAELTKPLTKSERSLRDRMSNCSTSVRWWGAMLTRQLPQDKHGLREAGSTSWDTILVF